MMEPVYPVLPGGAQAGCDGLLGDADANVVVIGQILLYWKPLQPGTRGVQGLLMDWRTWRNRRDQDGWADGRRRTVSPRRKATPESRGITPQFARYEEDGEAAVPLVGMFSKDLPRGGDSHARKLLSRVQCFTRWVQTQITTLMRAALNLFSGTELFLPWGGPSYRLLRNTTRRSHAVCALLYFPAVAELVEDCGATGTATATSNWIEFESSTPSDSVKREQVGTDPESSLFASGGDTMDESLEDKGRLWVRRQSTPLAVEPRLILYGGAMQESFEEASPGFPLSWLADVPLYRLVPDPGHPSPIFRLNATFFDNYKVGRVELESAGIDWSRALAEALCARSRVPRDKQRELLGPATRLGAASAVYKGRLYVFGGMGVTRWREAVLFNDLWVLSPEAEHPSSAAQAGGGFPQIGRVRGQRWQEVPLRSALRPPPCAFHLGAVDNGWLYILISGCVAGADLEGHSVDEPSGWVGPCTFNLSRAVDQRSLLYADYQRAQALSLDRAVLRAYKRRLGRIPLPTNQLWRIDLDSACPEWEELEVTVSKNMPTMVSGGIALTFYDGRLFVYGVSAGDPHVVIGILDVALKMWVAAIRLPGAPVWVTAVAVGKLWCLFGVESWSIFNLATFEWRETTPPTHSVIRYGCHSVWLPPYIPSPWDFRVIVRDRKQGGFGRRELRTMRRTDLAAQQFWLMQQGRRPQDHLHTILFIGGFDEKGQMSNQVDQILMVLPPSLAKSCFYPVWPETDILCASLFGTGVRRRRMRPRTPSEKRGLTAYGGFSRADVSRKQKPLITASLDRRGYNI